MERETTPPASVAVVLVNYNGGDYLRRALESLAAQTVRPQRVIVVDNDSRDASLALASAAYPDVEILPAGANLGFAAANNLAIHRAADCEWIALLNVDACASPDWLEQLLFAAARQPAASFFGSQLRDAADPSAIDGTGDQYHVSGLAWRRGHGEPAPPVEAPPPQSPVLGPCAAAALYRRAALVEVGGFDARFFCYLEDVDLAFRLRLAGHRYEYVPESIVLHVGSGLSGARSDFALYHSQRNVVWTFVKNMPAAWLAWYLPLHLAMNAAAILYATAKGRGSIVWKAKWDAIRGLADIWRSRREVQAARRLSSHALGELLVLDPFAPLWRMWRKRLSAGTR